MTRWLTAAYTVGTLVGSIVSMRQQLPGRPFGVDTHLPIDRALALGLGAGLAAPWPMVAALWWATRSFSRSREIAIRILAVTFLVGALSEGATYRAFRGRATPAGRLVAWNNLLVPLALLSAAGEWSEYVGGGDRDAPVPVD